MPLEIFLPPANYVKVKNESAKPLSNKDHSDLEKSLGDFGHKLVESVYKDYELQIKDWKNKFAKVMSQFGIAVARRDKTLNAAAKERERDAAIGAFILQLITAGSMSFLSTFVEYALIPSFQKAQQVKSWEYAHSAVFAGWYWKTTTVKRFDASTADFFGNLASNVGGTVVNWVGTPQTEFPQPKPKKYPIDTPEGVIDLGVDFQAHVDEAANVPLSQLADAQKWMRDSTEFGAAWLEYSQGDEERARTTIRNHFEKLRKEWADTWEFFGKTPNAISDLLADEYERGLWAAYFLWHLSPNGMTNAEQAFLKVYRGVKLLENPVVVRLKDLNVFMAETKKGQDEQRQRLADGAPLALTAMEGYYIDEQWEIDNVRDWAEIHLKNAGYTASVQFPPARKRALPSL